MHGFGLLPHTPVNLGNPRDGSNILLADGFGSVEQNPHVGGDGDLGLGGVSVAGIHQIEGRYIGLQGLTGEGGGDVGEGGERGGLAVENGGNSEQRGRGEKVWLGDVSI